MLTRDEVEQRYMNLAKMPSDTPAAFLVRSELRDHDAAMRTELASTKDAEQLCMDTLNNTLAELERVQQERDELEQQRIKYGPICVVCGAAAPCTLKDDPCAPCTFDPAPRELWDKVISLQSQLAQQQETIKQLRQDVFDEQALHAATKLANDANHLSVQHCAAKIKQQQETIRGLREALRALYDEQRDAPIETRAVDWTMAMGQAQHALGETDKPKEDSHD